MSTLPEKPRWIYRFDNYKRALGLLREAMETMEERELTQLEKEGVIQRFEYTWELAWKLIKDYLHHEGVVLGYITPASVIRAAIESRIISNGEVWMEALDARNKMSYVYNIKQFEKVIQQIHDHYLQIFDALYLSMMEKAIQEEGAPPHMSSHGLSSRDLDIMKQVLAPYSERIRTVGLFGSRATGRYRDYSDIDMVLYGDLNEADIDRLYTLFAESMLPYRVDINAYHLVEYAPLKAHIDATMTPLFKGQELL